MKNNQIVLFEIFYKRFRNIKETTSRLALEIYIEVYEPSENTVLLNKIIKCISITRHQYKKIELCMVQKLVESDVEGMKIIQKHPSKGILRKMCSENMQQIYRRAPIPKCDFNTVTLQLY